MVPAARAGQNGPVDGSPLDRWRVADVMSTPVRACAPDLPLVEVARLMVRERIHCVAVVEDPDGEAERFVGVLSDLDLVAAADGGSLDDRAGPAAGDPAVSIRADASLATAVREMREARVHHLVVVAGESGRPVGVLSTLDVARALADSA